MHYMALCLIVKDEPSASLREWVEYHLLAGAEQLLVYDHQSRRPVAEVLAAHAGRGLVEVVPIQGDFPQLGAYAHCLETFGPKFRWIGFLDVDEFLVPKAEDDFRLILERFERHAGLAVNWTMFGSSGHEERPEGLVVENYTLALPEDLPVNHHVKCFVDPSRTVKPLSPHHFRYSGAGLCVNERQMPVHGPRCPRSADLAQVNHYYFRSRRDFEEKMERGFAHDVPGRAGYVMEEFERQLSMETHVDDLALKNAPRIKAMMRSGSASLSSGFVYGRDLPPDKAVHGALALAGRGALGDALRNLRLACVRFPDLGFTRMALARVLRSAGRPEEAIPYALEGLGLDATPEGWIEYGLCLRAAGDEDGAIAVARWLRDELGRDGEWCEDWETRLGVLMDP